jgi:dihydroorotate dehydrogenase (fumarate)
VLRAGGPIDLGATLGGVRLPFCAMNASGARSGSAAELRALAGSAAGAVVLKTVTVHPFVHPQYRSLHNPGYDRLLPLVGELAAVGRVVVPSIAGATPDELVTLARAFADGGAAFVEVNLADPWVAATLAPFESRDAFRRLLGALAAAASCPLAPKLPDRPGLPYAVLGAALEEVGVRVVVARNDFGGFEKLLVEAGRRFDVVAVGGIRSGYDVTRALAKGAAAVQVGTALVEEGPAIFARLAREMRAARGERHGRA